MVSVFLVEDEFIVREGIKKNVDWSGHGYEFAGEAADGELALPLIRKAKPDIVITDIRMPFMDGLQLSRMIKNELPDTEIIILSGYSEFEYAKSAISIGVSRYLLKPVSGEDLLREVDTLSEKIRQRQKDAQLKEKYLREIEEKYDSERKTLFTQMVTGAESVSDLLDKSRSLGIDLSAPFYKIVLVGISTADHAVDEYSHRMVRAGEKIRELNPEPDCLVFDRELEGFAILYKADSQEQLDRLCRQCQEKMEEFCAGIPGLRYFGGIGKSVNRLSELPESFRMASRAYAHRYMTDKSQFLDSEQLKQSGADTFANQSFDMAALDPRSLERSRITAFLRVGEKDEAQYFVEEFFGGVGQSAMDSTLFRQYITMDAYFAVADFAEELSVDRSQIRQPGIGLTNEQATDYLIEIVRQGISLREEASSSRYRDIVRKVESYIGEHYADDTLSLNDLASFVNFSASHLSMIFSQEKGQTFVRFLTDYRMSKAKEMLRMTGMKSSEISEAVGYKDPHYFSYLFKKTVGVTPTQYREGGKSA